MLLEILHQFSKQNDKSIHYIYTLPSHVTYKSWIASTFLSNILYCYISIAAILAINFVHSAIGVMPSRYIETWEDADGTKFELLGLMTHLHFYAPYCHFQLPWIKACMGIWILASNFRMEPRQAYIAICHD